MLKPLIWKESRELLPLAVAALAADGVILSNRLVQPWIPGIGAWNEIPFVSDPAVAWLFAIAGALTIGAGFWQTWWESGRGTFPFLLHRPASRTSLIGAKLGAGLATCLLATLAPFVVYTLWAATPGTHASPFLWTMTAWIWPGVAILSLLYLGAFLSGLRPARWFGSRLFPLVGALFLLALVLLSIPWGAAVCLAALVMLDLALVLCILHIAAVRDYS